MKLCKLFENKIKLLLVFVFLISLINAVNAQNREGDSLALLKLYETTVGDDWKDNSNWKAPDKHIGEWHGITLTDGRVTAINLIDNNLIDELPDELNNLTELKFLYLSNNNIEDIAILDIPSLEEYYIDGNNLIFADIIPSIESGTAPSNFIYGSQHPIDFSYYICLEKNDFYEQEILFDNSPDNKYQWIKNGEDMTGENNSSIVINYQKVPESSYLACRITNPRVPGLTIFTTRMEVRVFKYIEAKPMPYTEICDSKIVLQAEYAADSSAISYWSLVSGSGTIANRKNTNSLVNNLAIGQNVFSYEIMHKKDCYDDIGYVTVFREEKQSTAQAISPIVSCEFADLHATEINAATIGRWKKDNINHLIDSYADLNTTIHNLDPGYNKVFWITNSLNNICPTDIYTVEITNYKNPTQADAGDLSEICDGSGTLNANDWRNGTGIGHWEIDADSRSFTTITSPTSHNSEIKILGENTASVKWMITNGTCPSSTSSINVTNVHHLEAHVFSPPLIYVCENATSIAASLPKNSIGHWSKYASSGATVISTNASTTLVDNLVEGENVFTWTIDNMCLSPTSSTLTVFREVASFTVHAGDDFESCTEASIFMNAENPTLARATGKWTVTDNSITIKEAENNESEILIFTGGDKTLSWNVTNGTCPPISDEVIVTARTPMTSIPSLGDAIHVCSDIYTFSTTLADNATGEWSVTKGSALIDPTTSTTVVLKNLTIEEPTTLRWTVNNICNSPIFEEVTIFRDVQPIFVDAGENKDICEADKAFITSSHDIGEGVWSDPNGNIVFQNDASNATQVFNLQQGVNKLVRTVTNGTCPSILDFVEINVYATPKVVEAGPSIQACKEITIEATVPDIGSGYWSTEDSNIDIISPSTVNTLVKLHSVYDYKVKWTVINGACSVSDFVTINTVGEVAKPVFSPAIIHVCENSTAISAPLTENGIGHWGDFASSGASVVNTNSTTTLVDNLVEGENIFTWNVDNICLSPTSSTLTIVRDIATYAVNAGDDFESCSEDFAVLNAAPPLLASAVGQWSATDASITVMDPLNNQSEVIILTEGDNTLSWDVTNGTCPPISDEVIVTVIPPVSSIPSLGDDIHVCTDIYTFSTTLADKAIGEWSVTSGSALIKSTSGTTIVLENLTVDQPTTLRWTVHNICSSSVFEEVTIYRDAQPNRVDAGKYQDICEIDKTLITSSHDIGEGVWSDPNEMVVFQDKASNATAVFNLQPGVNKLVRTVTNGVCPEISDFVEIHVYATPKIVEAGPAVFTCTETELNASVPDVGNGYWSTEDSNIDIISPSTVNTLVKLHSVSDYKVTWTVVNGACSASDFVTISTVGEVEQPVFSPAIIHVCENSTEISAHLEDNNIGHWGDLASSGASVINTNSTTTLVDNLVEGENIFTWNINNICQSPKSATLTIFRDIATFAVSAGDDFESCSEDFAVMNAAPPVLTGAVGQWSATDASITITEPTNNKSEVSFSTVGDKTLSWDVTNGTCPPISDEVLVTVRPPVSNIPSLGDDIHVCTDTYTLSTTLADNAIGEWSITGGAALIKSTSGTTIVLEHLTVDEPTTVRWTVHNICSSSVFEEVTIYRDAQPNRVDAGENQDLCVVGQTLITASHDIGEGVWSDTNGNALFLNKVSNTTAVFNLQPGVNKLIRTVTNGVCPEISDFVEIHVYTIPKVVEAGSTIEACSSTTLTATVPDIGNGYWSTEDSDIDIISPSTENTLVRLYKEYDYSLKWTVVNGACSASDMVTVKSLGSVDHPKLTEDAEICGDSYAISGLSMPTYGTGSWSVIQGSADFSSPSYVNTSFSNLGYAEPNILRWTVKNVCNIPAFDEIQITAYKLPVAEVSKEVFDACRNIALPAIAPIYGVGKWTIESGDVSVSSPNIFNSQAQFTNKGLNKLTWTVTNGSCTGSQSASKSVFITNAFEVSPTVLPDTPEICESEYTISGRFNSQDAKGGYWTVLEGGASVNSPSMLNTTFTNLNRLATNRLRWHTYNVCNTATTDFTIIAYKVPDINTLDDREVCVGTAIDMGATNDVGTGVWSVSPTDAVIENRTHSNTRVKMNNAGTYTYKWEVTNGACKTEQSYNIISHAPIILTQAETVTFCNSDNNNYDFSAISDPLYGVQYWDTEQGFANIISPNKAVTRFEDIAVGENIFKFTIDNVCGISTTAFTIMNHQNPSAANAGEDFVMCRTQNLAATPPNIGVGRWSLTRGTANIQDEAAYNSPIEITTEGEVNLKWTVSNGACADNTDELIITNHNPIATFNNQEDIELCESTYNFNKLSIGQYQTGKWTAVNSATISDIDNPTTTFGQLEVGENTFTWTVSNACPNDKSVQIRISRFEAPSTANAGKDFEMCGTGTLAATAPNIGMGRWLVTYGTANIMDAKAYNSPIEITAEGEVTLKWTISNGVCNNSTDYITITNQTPVASFEMPDDMVICSNISRIAGVPSPLKGKGIWTSNNSELTFGNLHFANTSISNIEIGEHRLTWTVDNICEKPQTGELVVSRNAPPTTADAGIGEDVCEETILAANVPTDGAGVWDVVSGTADIKDVNNPRSPVSFSNIEKVVLRWSVSNESCQTSQSLVTYDNTKPIKKPILTSNFSTCDTYAELDGAIEDNYTKLTWSLVSGAGEIKDPTQTQTSINGLEIGDNVIRLTVDNFCEQEASADLTITVAPYPIVTNNRDTTAETSYTDPFKFVNKTYGIGSENYTYQWSPSEYLDDATAKNPVFLPEESGAYNFVLLATNKIGCERQIDITVNISVKEGVDIPTLFTPNNDGINDHLYVLNIKTYPINEMQVFNSWGTLVYHKKDYRNDWDGRPNVSMSNEGEVLPIGTYFYVFKYGKGQVKKGFVEIRY